MTHKEEGFIKHEKRKKIQVNGEPIFSLSCNIFYTFQDRHHHFEEFFCHLYLPCVSKFFCHMGEIYLILCHSLCHFSDHKVEPYSTNHFGYHSKCKFQDKTSQPIRWQILEFEPSN